MSRGLRVQVVKPVKPVRYRIAPVEEKLDALEKLEEEFRKVCAKGGIGEDEIETYQAYLDAQRDKLDKAKNRALGIKPEKEIILVDASHDLPELPKCWRWYWSQLVNADDVIVKRCMWLAIAVFLYFKIH